LDADCAQSFSCENPSLAVAARLSDVQPQVIPTQVIHLRASSVDIQIEAHIVQKQRGKSVIETRSKLQLPSAFPLARVLLLCGVSPFHCHLFAVDAFSS